MPSYGISVYPDLSPLKDIKEYMALAARYGCSRVFSSMFSVEGSEEEILAYFKEFIDAAHAVGLQVSLDVNGPCLERFGASPSDLTVFHELGCDILRLDTPLSTEGYLQFLSNPYGICLELNASMGERGEAKLFELLEARADPQKLLLCHNFYPQRYTGMKWEKFKATNRRLKKTGIPIAAFVSSHAENTHGVWGAIAGLPTVERHRDLPMELQARELLATGDIDFVLIGNAYASEEEFKALQEVFRPVTPPADDPLSAIMKAMGVTREGNTAPALPKKLRIKLEPHITTAERRVLFEFYPHTDVGDSSEWIWRSRMPRFVYRKETFTPRPYEGEYFQVGDGVMVNDNYKHYAAEVQIVLKPI
ncbi:MAG: DUF871 family protein, partial [Oscillospiraceae bacterium]|nr:DUF871 family protein [Oscillospiraceae bacterium]